MNRPNLLSRLAVMAMTVASLLPPSAAAHGVSEADKAAMVSGGYIDYILLGARHMVTGYDHLLFLFGVMFFLTRFSEIVKFITAFTIGHTITLIGATYAGIQANYFLVDAIIAATVVYKGFDNLNGFRRFLDVKAPNLLAAVFVFGLIHGFGLSTRLQQLYFPDEGFLLRIISFNIGVELGQIAALTVMLALLSAWRHTVWFTKFSGAANTGLIVAGGLLFMMQVHGYSHTQYPDEFGFPAEGHAHAHETAVGAQAPGVHVHEDGSVHRDHSTTTDATSTHTHADGTVHPDHSAPAAAQPAAPAHVHADGTVHSDHDTHAGPSGAEPTHVHSDGTVHRDHGDSATAPSGSTHVHADGTVHADHATESEPPAQPGTEETTPPGASPLVETPLRGHTHSHGDGIPHEH